MSTHILLRGGTVFDGVSPRRAVYDLRVADGRIAECGPGLAPDGATVVAADGLWILPGFIDAHSHADAAVLTGAGVDVRALAGVTTEIVGQDGLGLSFTTGAARAAMAETLLPIAGEVPDREFADVAAYLGAVDRGAFARVATLVPHGTLRTAVMGEGLRPTEPAERAEMAARALTGIHQGAAGVSTGLSYAPALASDTAELVQVMSALPAGTPYVTHLRDYGAGFEAALDEAIRISRSGGASLHLSHFHVSGPGRAGHAATHLAEVTGLSGATWDSYPYISGCTFVRAILPEYTQAWSRAELVERLAEAAQADDLVRALDANGPGATVAGDWDVIRFAGLPDAIGSWNGRTVAETATAENTTPGRVVVRAVAESAGAACIIVSQGHLDNVRLIAAAEGHTVGSDGIMGSGIPHPRAAHSFWRFLHWAASGLLRVGVEQMVARMTSVTADRFGLPTGRLTQGAPADVLVVDAGRLADGPEFGAELPRALVHSYLGGEQIVTDGVWHGARLLGLALRSSRRTP